MLGTSCGQTHSYLPLGCEPRASVVPKRLEDANEQVASTAAYELEKIGPKAIPFLIDFLKREKDCSGRLYAAGALRRLTSRDQIVQGLAEETLEEISCGRSEELRNALRDFLKRNK
jgi:HEAT repeat protein